MEDKKEERNWNAGQWILMKNYLAHETFYEPGVLTEKKLDRCLQQFYKKINRVLDQVCPKKKISTKIRANVWYTKSLKEMAKRIKKAYKLSKRILGEAHAHYKNLVKKYKKLCKKRRRSSWRKYKERRQSVPEMVQLNNIIPVSYTHLTLPTIYSV